MKYVHILGATVILGTGTGIAFFMLMAHRTDDAAFVARTASAVVVADKIFTATALLIQPITGYFLMNMTGAEFADGWIALSLVLYVVAGLFWLPVVWMQAAMRDLAADAAARSSPLPDSYRRLFRIWFVFGFPGFGSVLAIVWLMVAKPEFGW